MNAASPPPAKPRTGKAKSRAAKTRAVTSTTRAMASKPRTAKPKTAVASKPAARKKPAALTAFVYVLGTCHKGRYLSYVGWTNDIARRLDKHNAGTGARSTRGRVWTLLHTEAFKTRNAAMSREWHLKRDRAFRKKLMDAVKAGHNVSSPLPVLTGRGRIASPPNLHSRRKLGGVQSG